MIKAIKLDVDENYKKNRDKRNKCSSSVQNSDCLNASIFNVLLFFETEKGRNYIQRIANWFTEIPREDPVIDLVCISS